MSIPNLTFPLRVDFSEHYFWIEDEGPFTIGEAVTDFLEGNYMGQEENAVMVHALWKELTVLLATYGVATHPYSPGGYFPIEIPTEIFNEPERSAVTCSICVAPRTTGDDNAEWVERYGFKSLRDFLYIELVKALTIGNAPRQCRRCNRWFLHQHGEKYVYCNRVSPGETEKTCREIGATANFEDKLTNNEVWKLYKRAYKKYYARVMKGRMRKQEFEAWVVIASALRDETNDLWLAAKTREEKDAIIQRYCGQLNCI